MFDGSNHIKLTYKSKKEDACRKIGMQVSGGNYGVGELG